MLALQCSCCSLAAQRCLVLLAVHLVFGAGMGCVAAAGATKVAATCRGAREVAAGACLARLRERQREFLLALGPCVRFWFELVQQQVEF